MSYDTIIIGLGAAGCAAAGTLCKAGKKVLALEAQDRIGGRVYTLPFGNGVVELGAEWIHGTVNSRTYELAASHNLPLLSQSLTFDVYRSSGLPGDKALVGELIEFCLGAVETPPKVPEPLGEHITRSLREYLTKNHPEVAKDELFIAEFLHFMDLLIDNYESSNSWNDVSTDTRYDELEGDQHLSWHKMGYKTLFDLMMNTYNNGPGFPNLNVQLNKEVTLIKWPLEAATDAEVTCKDGTVYTAKNVIVTVSVGVLKERHSSLFYPPLPSAKATAIDTLSIGVMDKIILSFEKPWWPKETTFVAFLWDREERRGMGNDWCTKIFGVSSPMGADNCLTVWTSGDGAKLIEVLPEDVVKRKVMELIRRFMGKDYDIPEPTGMVRSTWYSNPYTRGSYTYDSIRSPTQSLSRIALASPIVDNTGAPRLMFAGEATDNTHFSTVHGAIDTGYREAKRLLPQSKL